MEDQDIAASTQQKYKFAVHDDSGDLKAGGSTPRAVEDPNDPNAVFGGENEDEIDSDSLNGGDSGSSPKRVEEKQRDQDESVRVLEEEADDGDVGEEHSHRSATKRTPNQDSVIPNRDNIEEPDKLTRGTGIQTKAKVCETDGQSDDQNGVLFD